MEITEIFSHALNFDTEKNIHIDTIDIFMILKSPT